MLKYKTKSKKKQSSNQTLQMEKINLNQPKIELIVIPNIPATKKVIVLISF